MNLKILFFILPFFVFGQTTNTSLNKKIKIIDSLVKSTDSLSSYREEEIFQEEIVASHGRLDGKPERRLYTNTRILRDSKILKRICYRVRHQKTDEDLALYFHDDKLIFSELITWRARRKKSTKKQFYFENDQLIYPIELSDKVIEDEIYCIEQSIRLRAK